MAKLNTGDIIMHKSVLYGVVNNPTDKMNPWFWGLAESGLASLKIDHEIHDGDYTTLITMKQLQKIAGELT